MIDSSLSVSHFIIQFSGYVQVEKMILEGDTRNSIWTSSEPPSTPSASLKGYKGRRALSKIPNWI
uniref:Uncharacterized protein n=1 Tax=Lepeophtheirus salmonis TaxID=72036 RepID=A0A0K2UHH4_LEPSM